MLELIACWAVIFSIFVALQDEGTGVAYTSSNSVPMSEHLSGVLGVEIETSVYDLNFFLPLLWVPLLTLSESYTFVG